MVVVRTQEKEELIFRQQRLKLLNLKFFPFILNSFWKKMECFLPLPGTVEDTRENTMLFFALVQ